ncbi:unnamed protein product [Lactuca saligna]|uniref:Uncharacterized protein n=1 Tax=Lactuca saligna TaxID=75948 RepID=A0AA36EHB2_LACSI|nr:unnamed protein product [Lactuca saligna]
MKDHGRPGRLDNDTMGRGGSGDKKPYEEDEPSEQAGGSDEPVDIETEPVEEETEFVDVVTESVEEEIDPAEEEVDYSEWEDEEPKEEREIAKEPEPAIEQ